MPIRHLMIAIPGPESFGLTLPEIIDATEKVLQNIDGDFTSADVEVSATLRIDSSLESITFELPR